MCVPFFFQTGFMKKSHIGTRAPSIKENMSVYLAFMYNHHIYTLFIFHEDIYKLVSKTVALLFYASSRKDHWNEC